MGTKLKTNQKGFTIIEVTIVLAIAAVIMVIVFAAVPALNRSSRNNQRRSDASHFASLVSEATTNAGGTAPASITTTGETFLQLSTISNTNGAGKAATAIPGNSTTTLYYVYSATCTTGNTQYIGAAASQAAVMFNVEGTNGSVSPQCIAVN